MAASVGQTLGSYKLEAVIGKGAFGQVFRAVAVRNAEVPLGTEVAVKVLHEIYQDDPGVLRRFHREARLAKRLEHPHVVRVLAEGEERGEHYIVMELAVGMSLTQYLWTLRRVNEPDATDAEEPENEIESVGRVSTLSPAEDADESPEAKTPEVLGRAPLDEAVAILRQVADVLRQAHEIGLVHRDIKPENIVVSRDAEDRLQTKLLDFGLAKDAIAQSTLTTIGHGVGTPAFMSPEQFEGRDMDIRSDLYSLGATAYQTLTGRLPFEGPTLSAYVRQHLDRIPTPAQTLNPDIPLAMSQVIDRLMAKNPRNRYQTPGELLEDLDHVERDEPPATVFDPYRIVKIKRLVGGVAVVMLIALAAAIAWMSMTVRTEADARAEARAAARARYEAFGDGLFGQEKDYEAAVGAYSAALKYGATPALRRKLADAEKALSAERARYEATRRDLLREHFEELGDAMLASGFIADAVQAYRKAATYRRTPELVGKLRKAEQALKALKRPPRYP